VGLYHAFSSTSSTPFREHKLYIVVSGCLVQAAESLHNLWQDTKHDISCAEFSQSEELNWLRQATQRNHNRVAADVASIFGLAVHQTLDLDDPSGKRCMLFPSSSTIQNDVVLCAHSDRVKLTDHACLPECSSNGIIFEMYSCEGFWLFHGPQDNSSCNPYGGEFLCVNNDACFPTKTCQYHGHFHTHPPTDVVSIPCVSNASTLFARSGRGDPGSAVEPGEEAPAHTNSFVYPSENFMRVLQRLGFNRNDGITNLMPLVCYVSNE
jgi:hypothetical protein